MSVTGELRTFSYVALSQSGRRSRGAVSAQSARDADSLLRARELTPLRIRDGSTTTWFDRSGSRLSAAAIADFLFSLGRLLRAGASLRAALAMLDGPSAPPQQRETCRRLLEETGAGRPLAEAFGIVLGARAVVVPALIAAGERAGELAASLEAASQQIRKDLDLRIGILSAASYPAFILLTFAGALLLLVLVVAPSLAPLIAESGGRAPFVLGVLLAVSALLREQGWLIALVALGIAAALTAAARANLLTPGWERFEVDGPLRAFSTRLFYGRAATVIGRLLASGTPAPEAMRLGAAVVRNGPARRRLEQAAGAVMSGAPLSAALAACVGFPLEIVRMAQLGEQTGELGSMLQGAGELAQASAIQWVERVAKWLAPALIVTLGALIGGMMASLLSAISSLGGAALD